MKFGLEWNYRYEGTIDEQAKQMKDNGFDATFVARIEKLEEIMAALDKYSIVCESYHAPFDHINDMWLPGDAGEIMLRRICDCVDACATYGIPVVVVHLSSGKNPPRINDIGFDRYDRLMEYAKDKGVTVAYENIRKLDNVAFAMENYPEAGFCWDVGHEACYTYGMEFMHLFGKRIVALHLHDNTGIYDEDMHWLPFDGVVDMEKAARYLAVYQYQKSIMLEVTADSAGIGDSALFYKRAYEVATRFASLVEKYKNA